MVLETAEKVASNKTVRIGEQGREKVILKIKHVSIVLRRQSHHKMIVHFY